MSLPNIPNITPIIDIDRGEAITMLLASIAMEEMGLSHIINAEGEKIQYVLNSQIHKSVSIKELMEVNQGVERVIREVMRLQMLLQQKLESVISVIPKDHDCPNPCDKPCYPEDQCDKPCYPEDQCDKPCYPEDQCDKPCYSEDQCDIPFFAEAQSDKPFFAEAPSNKPFFQEKPSDKPFFQGKPWDKPCKPNFKPECTLIGYGKGYLKKRSNQYHRQIARIKANICNDYCHNNRFLLQYTLSTDEDNTLSALFFAFPERIEVCCQNNNGKSLDDKQYSEIIVKGQGDVVTSYAKQKLMQSTVDFKLTVWEYCDNTKFQMIIYSPKDRFNHDSGIVKEISGNLKIQKCK